MASYFCNPRREKYGITKYWGKNYGMIWKFVFQKQVLAKTLICNCSIVKRQLLQTETSGWAFLNERKHGPNKRIVEWNKGMDRKTHRGEWWRTLVVPSQLYLKCDADIKEIGWLQYENTLVHYEKRESVRIENSKRHVLQIDNLPKKVKKKINK